jgi:hypothetical protein
LAFWDTKGNLGRESKWQHCTAARRSLPNHFISEQRPFERHIGKGSRRVRLADASNNSGSYLRD